MQPFSKAYVCEMDFGYWATCLQPDFCQNANVLAVLSRDVRYSLWL
jgi:hypothetical protein